jgi:hypothetical protein
MVVILFMCVIPTVQEMKDMNDYLPNKIYVLGRNNYDAGAREHILAEDSIYLVRENSDETYKILSMYLGYARQTDVLDISDDPEVSYDDETKEYDIPDYYKIKNKLFYASYPLRVDNPDYYRLFAWNGAKFVDCLADGGSDKQEIKIVDTLPQTGEADILYILTRDSDGKSEGIYVYMDDDYVAIVTNIDLSDYITSTEYNSTKLVPDDITIRKNTNTKIISGAGANIEGMSIQGATAKTGAHIYNYYDTNNFDYYNMSGLYANAFGKKSRALGDYSLAYGNDIHVADEATNGVAIGNGLINKSENAYIIGQYNSLSSNNTVDSGTNRLPKDYAFIIGNGSDSNNRSDAISIDWYGNIKLYGNNTANSGNIESCTGASLTTFRDIISGPFVSNTIYEDTYLQQNSHEILLGYDALNDTYTSLSGVQINHIAKVMNNTTNRSDDYSCIYVFKKSDSVTEIADLMPNFTSSNYTDDIDINDDPPHIYLINPDLDIATYNVIHIFVFYDGMNMCSIVAGY